MIILKNYYSILCYDYHLMKTYIFSYQYIYKIIIISPFSFHRILIAVNNTNRKKKMSDDLKILDSFINFAVKTYNRSGQGEGD
jgi:hypothetical protein